VLVAAPTGAGKTVAADFAMFLVQERNVKAFYTTPIKALSNQKYHDLVAVYGSDKVGLLTGDTSINAQADIVVMTTEVLRNMLYERSSTLDALRYVVPGRGALSRRSSARPVWEEVIIIFPSGAHRRAERHGFECRGFLLVDRLSARRHPTGRVGTSPSAIGTARHGAGRSEDRA
jgi:ATP-dependent RNA helicase HelY